MQFHYDAFNKNYGSEHRGHTGLVLPKRGIKGTCSLLMKYYADELLSLFFYVSLFMAALLQPPHGNMMHLFFTWGFK